MMCSAFAERDAHFVRDASFGREVRSAREQGTHRIIARVSEHHHCAIGKTSLAR